MPHGLLDNSKEKKQSEKQGEIEEPFMSDVIENPIVR